MKKKTVFLIVRILISISAFGFLLFIMRDRLGKIQELLVNMKKEFFLLSLFLYLIIPALLSCRLRILLKAQDILFPYRKVLKLTFIGYFFNNFLPSAVGGDVVKGYYAYKASNKKLTSFTTVFVDRLTGVTSLVFFMTLALLFINEARSDRVAFMLANTVIIVVLFTLIFLLNKGFARKFSFLLKILKPFKLDEKLRKVYYSINNYNKSKSVLFKAFLISFCAQLIPIAIFFSIGKSLGIDFSISLARDLLWVIPLSGVVSMCPSINGIGVREGAFVYFLRRVVNPEVAFSISLIFLSLLLTTGLIGGIVYIFRRDYKLEEMEKLED